MLRHQDGKTELAPFYDLVCTHVFSGISKDLAFQVGGRFDAQYSKERTTEVAKQFGVAPRLAEREWYAIREAISNQLPNVATDIDTPIRSTWERAIRKLLRAGS
jgi:serine/threonine-protein kinase HipA